MFSCHRSQYIDLVAPSLHQYHDVLNHFFPVISALLIN